MNIIDDCAEYLWVIWEFKHEICHVLVFNPNMNRFVGDYYFVRFNLGF